MEQLRGKIRQAAHRMIVGALTSDWFLDISTYSNLHLAIKSLYDLCDLWDLCVPF